MPSCWNIESETAPAVLNVHPARLPVCYIFFTASDSYQSTVLQRAWDAAAKKVAQALHSDRAYVSRMRRSERREGARITRLVALLERIDWSACSDDELVRWMKKIKKQWIAYDQATVTAWYVGGDMFHAMASKQLNIPDNDFLALATPSAPTHASRYEKDILRAACAVQKGAQERSRAARTLAKKYGWLPFGYDGPDYWDADYFEKK